MQITKETQKLIDELMEQCEKVGKAGARCGDDITAGVRIMLQVLKQDERAGPYLIRDIHDSARPDDVIEDRYMTAVVQAMVDTGLIKDTRKAVSH